ncbi:MAG: peptidase M22 [Clostridia bacterium]|nr:peptidase M22 [Clostridia bacterium]
MKKVYLGLDTSNYTTSAAISTEDGEVLLNEKLLLPVKEGERGLRQSDAVFLHVKALTAVADAVRDCLASFDEAVRIEAIGVSARPRDGENSYMPCFLVGEGVGKVLGASMGVPVYTFSHQAGHVMAAVHSACRHDIAETENYIKTSFYAFHVSGGTTEVLQSDPDSEKVLHITKLGGTMDLNAGQVIDRTGVRMGMQFPCGAVMDGLALEYGKKQPKDKIHVKDMFCNLSGIENKAEKLWKTTGNTAEVSSYVFSMIGRTLEEMTLQLLSNHEKYPIIYAGGVMSSLYIKQILNKYGVFAEARMSSDNAVGTSLLARHRHMECRNGAENYDK